MMPMWMNVCVCFFGMKFSGFFFVLVRKHAVIFSAAPELIFASLFFLLRVIIHPQFHTPICEVITIPRLAIERREKRNYVSGPLVYASRFFSRICYFCVRKKYFSGFFYRNHACRVCILFFLIQTIYECRLLNALEIYFYVCFLFYWKFFFYLPKIKKGE